MNGKAYANKKKKEDRPKGDFYSTPKSLIWVAEKIIKKEFYPDLIFEPAAGQNEKQPITEELKKMGYIVESNDMFSNGFDYLSFNNYKYRNGQIITNPPFSLWDEFVKKAKTHCRKIMFIGRLNYLGTYQRFEAGIFKNLKYIMPFNRYVDYQTPYRNDGLFHVGSMATCWLLWDTQYTGNAEVIQLDVQKYAKLGNYKGV
jgi:hypothetical protein